MDQAMTFMARNWWIVLLRGIAAILFGLAAFVWPGLTVAVLVMMFGAYILVDGLIGTIDAIKNRQDNGWFGLLDGVVGMIVGAIMLFIPGLSALMVLIFVAAWSILGGALRIFAAVQLRKQIEGEWFLIISGILSIVFGIAIVVLPHAGLVSIAWIIGFWALAFGVSFIFLAFRLRKIAA